MELKTNVPKQQTICDLPFATKPMHQYPYAQELYADKTRESDMVIL